MPFYIGDLSIPRFGYLGSPVTNPLQIQWDSLILGEVKSYTWFMIIGGESEISKTHVVQGSIILFYNWKKNLKGQLFFTYEMHINFVVV